MEEGEAAADDWFDTLVARKENTPSNPDEANNPNEQALDQLLDSLRRGKAKPDTPAATESSSSSSSAEPEPPPAAAAQMNVLPFVSAVKTIFRK